MLWRVKKSLLTASYMSFGALRRKLVLPQSFISPTSLLPPQPLASQGSKCCPPGKREGEMEKYDRWKHREAELYKF